VNRSVVLHNMSMHAMIEREVIAALAVLLASDQVRQIIGQSAGAAAISRVIARH